MRELILEGNHLSKRFGGVLAVQRVSIRLYRGETVGIVGSNGAGKTTLFDLLSGCVRPDSGEIYRNGRRQTGGMEGFVSAGITRTFQNLRLFPKMTVNEHLQVPLSVRKTEISPQTLLKNTPLEGKETLLATKLPYGQMRMLELLRGVATGCEILMLDEPGAGLSKEEKKQLLYFLEKLRETYALSFLVIEHDLEWIETLCSRVYAMHFGRLLAEGTPKEVFANPQVKQAFLG